jgi:hypothetical protein
MQRSNNVLNRRMPAIDNAAHLRRIGRLEEKELVYECNMHPQRHSDTCTKTWYGKVTGCRFGFPRPLVGRETFISADGRIKAKRNDPWLNGYNPYILNALRCNHDLRFLFSGPDANAAMQYCGDYITKAAVKILNRATCMEVGIRRVEKMELSGKLFSPVERARQMIIRALNQLAGHSERMGPEVAHQLLGNPLAYKSHAFVPLLLTQFLRFVEQAEGTAPASSSPSPPQDQVF